MTMPNGTQALVFFELIERNGHLIAKAIRAEAIDLSAVPEQKVCALPGIKSPTKFVPIISNFYSVVDLFCKDLSFVMSQPTRAPSL